MSSRLFIFCKGDRATIVGGMYYQTGQVIGCTIKEDIIEPGFVAVAFDKPQNPRNSFVSRTKTKLHSQSLQKIKQTTKRVALNLLDTVTLDEVEIPDKTRAKICDLCDKFCCLGITESSAQASVLINIGMREKYNF